jgi:hypothetical protein
VRSAVDEFFAGLGLEVHATSADRPWISWIVELPLTPWPVAEAAGRAGAAR